MPFWARATGWLIAIAFAFALAGAAGLFAAVERTSVALPEFEEMKVTPTGRTVRIHAADGSVLETMGPVYGEWLTYDQIPQNMRNAIIAIEDRRYESHFGIDPKALVRALWLAYKYRGTDRRLQGASTITQQAARTVFLSQQYDIKRKLKEMIFAMALERRLDKKKILELYLNRVYLGGGAYGIDAASRKFFGHPATELTLSEAALLAGLAKAPSDYSPSADTQAAYGRMKVVLKVMKDTGRASPDNVKKALEIEPELAGEQKPQGNGARYFVDWIRPQIEAIAPGEGGMLDVWTTYDPALQAEADKAISANVPKGVQGALVSLDEDGAVRAMVGGTDYMTSSYNRATQAQRQPGSAFKLFVYLAALERGYSPSSTVVDAPINISGWSPKNADGAYRGPVSLATGFSQSINTVAARLGQNVGVENIARMAWKMGFSTRMNIDPAMVLGTSEARLIDMTRAFSTVAAGGLERPPYGIIRIEENGREIYKYTLPERMLIAPQVAKDMTAMLRSAVNVGTGRAANIGRPVAGKTGTTSSNKDGWFIGFSSGITTGVWMGRDDAKPISGLQGGRSPARAFAQYMQKAVQGRPEDQAIAMPVLSVADEEETPISVPKGRNSESEEKETAAPREEIAKGDSVSSMTSEKYGKSRAIPGDDE